MKRFIIAIVLVTSHLLVAGYYGNKGIDVSTYMATKAFFQGCTISFASVKKYTTGPTADEINFCYTNSLVYKSVLDAN